ncbi:transcription elongation factor A protein-like 8 [Molossus nigricans]
MQKSCEENEGKPQNVPKVEEDHASEDVPQEAEGSPQPWEDSVPREAEGGLSLGKTVYPGRQREASALGRQCTPGGRGKSSALGRQCTPGGRGMPQPWEDSVPRETEGGLSLGKTVYPGRQREVLSLGKTVYPGRQRESSEALTQPVQGFKEDTPVRHLDPEETLRGADELGGLGKNKKLRNKMVMMRWKQTFTQTTYPVCFRP